MVTMDRGLETKVDNVARLRDLEGLTKVGKLAGSGKLEKLLIRERHQKTALWKGGFVKARWVMKRGGERRGCRPRVPACPLGKGFR